MASKVSVTAGEKIENISNKIEDISKEIKDIIASDEYKAISRKFAWGKPRSGTSFDDESTWCFYQEQIKELKEQRRLYASLTVAAIKKTDETRRGYKRSTAVKSER